MAEPSLLCVNCARPPPPHRRTWSRCTVCVERNLPSTYYCGEECMNAHWPKHQQYHKAQKEWYKEMYENGQLDRTRSLAEEVARRAERTGDEYDKRCAAALAFGAEGDHHGEAKAWRKIIKAWPDSPDPYFNLAVALDRADRVAEAAPMLLKAMELYPAAGTGKWAISAAAAFDLLRFDCSDEVPKPEWWNDEALKALSARVVALVPDRYQPCAMRARVLSGGALHTAPWHVGPRIAAEIKEAATWYRRAAMLTPAPSGKLRADDLARQCDEFADPLLLEEEAEASAARAAAEAEAEKARASAEAEAAKALKVAEAKATAAADELLAEEEKEKQQVSAKAGKAKVVGKGKKGKGKR